jgi:hypothetical protein
MIDVTPHRAALADRITVVVRLIDEAHPPPPEISSISRETRGLAVVLLFAAYEELLTSLTRTLLEAAIRMRVGNRRLQPGFRAFALHSAAKSVRNVSERKLFLTALPGLVDAANSGKAPVTINPDDFPSDGSFMKRSQIETWARLFNIGSPEKLLSRTWSGIDAVVAQRNGVAHGRLTPQEVGRNYSEAEVRQLITDWALDWDEFLIHVALLASSRDFFRVPR